MYSEKKNDLYVIHPYYISKTTVKYTIHKLGITYEGYIFM